MKLTRLQFLGSLVGGAIAAPVAAKVAAITVKETGCVSDVMVSAVDAEIVAPSLFKYNAATIIAAFNSQTYIQDKLDVQSYPLFEETTA